MKIYHNPRCSKSRQTLALLTERGIEPEIVLYLESPPSVEDLKDILKALGMSANQLVRKKEAEYKSLDIDENDEEALLAAMHQFPKIIERPIVVNGQKAALGRPPEQVLEIL